MKMNSKQQEQLEQQRESWNRFSAGWKKWDGFLNSFMVSVGKALIETLHVKGSEHVLDIASGPGEPGLTLSAFLPQGKVTAIDLSEKMVNLANENALHRGIKNYESMVGNALELPFKDKSFDHVICRFGIMFFPDIEKGLKEMARVLKPGGTLAVAVWAAPELNPFLTLLGRTVMEKLDLPKPEPDAPNVFRCAHPGYTSQLFRDVGLVKVTEKNIQGQMIYDSPEQYWELSSDIAGPIMEAMKNAPAEVVDNIKTTVIKKADHFLRDGKMFIGWEAITVNGKKK
jgi:ubiquinone/menaquinone biosynthesis C-methylase UbiE